jgi:signal transduction histidine kinase
LLAVVAEVSPSLGFDPQVRFSGPIDSVVSEDVVEDLVAVLREALTNVARHAGASQVEVDVGATSSELTMSIVDDGVGIGAAERRSGLANLRQRAEHYGGSLVFSAGRALPAQLDREGTCLQWTIPLR